MKNDKLYWEQYYKKIDLEERPSLFAEYILSRKYIEKNSNVIEFGCGNGRDARFLALNCKNYTAIDITTENINRLNQRNAIPNLAFKSADFSNLGNIGKFDVVYSRFTMHSINDVQQNRTIEWVGNSLNVGGYLLVEARGLKNEICGLGEPVKNESNAFIYDDHYRRFIDADKLAQQIQGKKMRVIYFAEQKGFAPFMDKDETFFRLIAQKTK